MPFNQDVVPRCTGITETARPSARTLGVASGAPMILFARLSGMAMNILSAAGACQVGIEFAGRQILHMDIGLLGLRITAARVVTLGWQPLLGVGVLITMGASIVSARLMGFRAQFGLLIVGATTIRP